MYSLKHKSYFHVLIGSPGYVLKFLIYS